MSDALMTRYLALRQLNEDVWRGGSGPLGRHYPKRQMIKDALMRTEDFLIMQLETEVEQRQRDLAQLRGQG